MLLNIFKSLFSFAIKREMIIIVPVTSNIARTSKKLENIPSKQTGAKSDYRFCSGSAGLIAMVL